MRATCLRLVLLMILLPSVASAAPPFCGDNKAKGGEACDGSDLRGNSCTSLGFDGGALACTGSCELDTSGCTTSATPTCGAPPRPRRDAADPPLGRGGGRRLRGVRRRVRLRLPWPLLGPLRLPERTRG